MTATTGLALLGQREACGALYPLALELVQTGVVVDLIFVVGPQSSQLVAGIAAHAAGLDERAREHFEIATCQAKELPHRILQPTVLYWYGRMLADHIDPTEQARGRAMVAAAAADFRSLKMVLHAKLADEFLRS
jgi:hypothetical protein